ncbi:MAG TPA: hypothetical protein GXX33_03005 [Firmicutes bacterium]|uniref:Uncharacterized protein n=1 Tax=Capillibacterium thermochitinicola TaxID=2699427 RepID=A0A8J6HS50_9FIRM|nr:hypothetical protein [Capillibacterium thermochitinicola]MBA2133116.1 hypothetical protein [Capillibacterium thermochitinicola]HHW11956.1 hypothetical protein [Bacillota bacterium]
MIVLIVLIFVGIFLSEARGLVAEEYWRELAVFTLLMLLGLFLSILLASGADLPYVESLWLDLFAGLRKGLFPGS